MVFHLMHVYIFCIIIAHFSNEKKKNQPTSQWAMINIVSRTKRSTTTITSNSQHSHGFIFNWIWSQTCQFQIFCVSFIRSINPSPWNQPIATWLQLNNGWPLTTHFRNFILNIVAAGCTRVKVHTEYPNYYYCYLSALLVHINQQKKFDLHNKSNERSHARHTNTHCVVCYCIAFGMAEWAEYPR